MKVFAGIFSITMILLAAASCQQEVENADRQYSYFNIDSFFKNEISRFEKTNPLVEKTVSQNSITERKTVKIVSWSNELDLFLSSDINKPAWKDSYKIIRNNGEIQYIATDPKLRTRKIVIDKTSGGQIQSIRIFNQVSNLLYSSTEELVYFPDSLYQVIKNQQVRVIGANHYQVTGKLKFPHNQ